MDLPDQSDTSSSSPSPDLIKVKKVKSKSQTKIKVKRHRSLSKTKLVSNSSNSSLCSKEEVLKQYYRVKSREPAHKEKVKAKRRKTPGGHSAELIGKSTSSQPPIHHEQEPTTADVDSVVETKDEHNTPDKSVPVDVKSEDKELDHKNDTQEVTVKEVEKSLENPQSGEVTESKASDENEEDSKATEAMPQDSSKKSSIEHNETEVEEKMAKSEEDDTKGKAALDKVDEPQLKEVQAKEHCEAKDDELWKTPNSASLSPDTESIPKTIQKRKKSLTKIKVKRYRSASSLGKDNSSSSGSLSKDQMVQQYFRVKSQEPPHKQKTKAKRRKSIASLTSKGQVDCEAKVSNEHHDQENDQKAGIDESVTKEAHKSPDKPLTSGVANQPIQPEPGSEDQENKDKSAKLLEHQVVLDQKEGTEEMDNTKAVTALEMSEPLAQPLNSIAMGKEEVEANSKPIVDICEAGPNNEMKEDKPLELEHPVGDDHKSEIESSANSQNLADSAEKYKLESQPVTEEVRSNILEETSKPLEKKDETQDQVTDDYKDKLSSQTEADTMQDIAKANGQNGLADVPADNKEKVVKLDETDPKVDHTKPEPKVVSTEFELNGVSHKRTVEGNSVKPQTIVPTGACQPLTISIRSGNLQLAPPLTIEPTDANADTTQHGAFLIGAIILIIAIYLMFMR